MQNLKNCAEIMEEEVLNFIMVGYSVLMSSCYCYGITKLVPQGVLRFITFVPVLCLYLLLPLYLNCVNFIIPTVFSVTWLTSFKILLLAFGTGPLSNPSLSLFHFALISCLPIKLSQATSSKPHSTKGNIRHKKLWASLKKSPGDIDAKSYEIGFRSLSHNIARGSVMIFLIYLGFHKEHLPHSVVSLLACVFVCVGLQIVLEGAAFIGGLLLGTRVERPFDQPHLSNSFGEFWGDRWNRVAASGLHATVFAPTVHHMLRVLGMRRATVLALFATFFTSGLMHEMIFFFLVRRRPGWGTQLFFLLQGLCVVMESALKRKLDLRWRLSSTVTGPLILVFVLCSFMWLALPELMEHRLVDRALEEYAAVGAFVRDSSHSWVEAACNLLVKLG